jgi:N-acyl-D-aspartate/D-glutamate deacylase
MAAELSPPVLIRGGTVFDGSGQRPGLRADVLVRDGIVLEVGRRADPVVVDPATLDDRLVAMSEEEMVGMLGLDRLVRRHDECVPAVVINGRLAWRNGTFTPGFGEQRSFGRLLRAEA